MKTGYQEHFEKKKKAAAANPPKPQRTPLPLPQRKVGQDLTAEKLRQILRTRNSDSLRKRALVPSKLIISFALTSMAMGFGWTQIEVLDKWMEKIEISFVGAARAETKADSKAEAATEKKGAGAGKNESEAKGESASPAVGDSAASGASDAAMQSVVPVEKTPEEAGHLTRLNERKKELDAREAELARAEADLELQRKELEERITKLHETREQISSMLQDRVQTDEKKVEDLVQVYSTMKPVQAAKVFETMDEALAVEILGRMKKKPAAEILNLIKADKAQSISEKYAGYKRKTN